MVRNTHEEVDDDQLLEHLMEDHGVNFLSTGSEPEDPERAAQHLRDVHARCHTVHNGTTDNLHYDLMSGRWRYNDGVLSESTKTGPVRHRAPIDLTYVEADEECSVCGSLENVDVVWVPDPGDSEYGDSLPRCPEHRPHLVDRLLGPVVEPEFEAAGDLDVSVIPSGLLARFGRRMRRTGV
jgi:hypothetical protein